MKFIVYCTTNLVNKKIYIGVHRTLDPNKFDGYLGNDCYATQPSSYAKPRTAFQAAVKKYGPKNFSRSILFIYDSLKEALLKEKELVNKDFIKLDTNYNMIEGGGQYNCDLPLYQFNDEGIMVKYWEHESQVIELFNCSINAIRTAIHFKEKLFGYFWSREESINRDEYSKGSAKKPVYKYTEKGKLIAEYISLSEAAKENGITPSSLVTAINGQALVGKQFYYSYSVYDEFIPKPKVSLRGKKFYLYTLEGEYVQTFENSKDLMTFMGVKSISSVSDVIHRRNGLYKDYQIKLEKFDKVEPIINKSKCKKVDVFDKEGNFIKTCESVQQSAKEFNAKASSINRVLRGLACTTAGYIFKFHKEN